MPTGDLDEADQILEEALDLYPNKMIYANLGEIHRRRRNFDEALAAYAKARELDTRYANGINETGMVYLAMAREERAHGGRVEELLAEAERRHRRALDVVPISAKHQREDLRRKFEEARVKNGFSREPTAAAPPAVSSAHE